MKVLHVIPSLSAVHGGPTRALGLMESALAARGVTVETATTDDDGPGRRNGKVRGRPLAEGAATRRYFRKTFDFYKTSVEFARWIARHAGDYDLLHIHALFSFTTPVAAWAARRAGVPYVVRPLGTLNGYGLRHRRPWLKRASVRWVEAPLLRRAAAVHFTSDEEAREAASLGIALRGVVIPLGVETPAACSPARTAPPRDVRQVLFLSRLDPKKNLESLIDAVALLTAGQGPVQLVVAGAGDPGYVATLRARADARGIASRVQWLGHVEGDTKAHALASAQLFVLPSFSENFGIAAAEALAAGLPCVLGQGVAIAGDVASAGAGLAVAPDPASIAAGLQQLLDDAPRRDAMSLAARRLAVERFSAGAMAESLERLYAEVLQR
jgi:glycosyltransferase involved in cell wall biosynthesis